MNILVAGSTGYLGGYIVKELKESEFNFKAVARNEKKLLDLGLHPNNIVKAEVTQKESLNGICNNIDVVISTVGITRQKDGLTYMDVDYQANKNLLDEAVKSGVKKFIYISVLNGEQLKHVAICKAKEKFVDELKSSGLDFTIIRPGGFFSDMAEFHTMAKKGKIYLFGDGNYKSNPIHGEDLAEVCVNAVGDNRKEIKIGGPEIFTQTEIAGLAFDAIGEKARITYLPDWIRKTALKIGKLFISKSSFGPFEFFMNVMAMDMVAPSYGKRTLYEFYKSLN
ncbi:MAG: SDR family oxidoreductase [Bacteroidetes bacterium]|nr:MAG: SDR family oxidoreductase [Bacteroidota bacterium]